MLTSVRSRLYALAVATASVAIALALMLLLNPVAQTTRTSFLLFFGAIVFTAWQAGVRAGLLATLLSGLLSSYFFLPEFYSFNLEPVACIRLVLFLILGAFISLLCGSLRTAHQQLDANILRLQASEESLRSANQCITDILESITDGFYALDHQWRFVYVNGQTESHMRHAREYLLGRSIWEVLPEAEGTVMGNAYRQAMQTRQSVVVETAGLINPDRWYELNVKPIPDGLAVYFRDLTHRKRDERQLRQHMQMVNLANDGIIIRGYEDDRISYWNQGAVRLFGFATRAAVGQKAHQLLHIVFPERIADIRQTLIEQNFWQGELTYTCQDGTQRVVSSRWTLQRSATGDPQDILEISRDITHQKQAQAALQRSELYFRTLANTMPQMVWTTQPDGEVDYFNQRWYDYTGLAPDQSLGWGWRQVVHPEDQSRCTVVWNNALLQGHPYQVEYRFRRAEDGAYRWHLGLAYPLLDGNGKVSKWFGSCTDIHDQKLVLAERDRALERERAARQEAEAASRSKDEFLAVLSHELRSPLNPILGWVSLLRTRNLSEQTFHQALETIERNAKLQTQLIEDLLDVSRILRGKLSLNIESVDLAQVLQAALQTAQLSIEAKKILLNQEIAADIPPVAGDPNRIQQIIWNLLSNAVKFTPDGGSITVRLLQVDSCIHLQVQDTGRGIAPEFLPYIFERFRQADSTTTRQFGGLGLGLSIVRYLCELHGGSVHAESPGENHGSTFTACLPISNHQDHSGNFEPIELASQPLAANLLGLTVLVIDDDPDQRDLLTVALQEHGVQVLRADSAQAGLETLDQHCPDIIICDIGMPEVDGYGLVRRLRQRADGCSRIPAIALTAYAGEFNRQAALEAGFQSHLSKPVALERLRSEIASLVAPRP